VRVGPREVVVADLDPLRLVDSVDDDAPLVGVDLGDAPALAVEDFGARVVDAGVEIVAPEIGASLLAALPLKERAIWATALYARAQIRRAASTPLEGRRSRSTADRGPGVVGGSIEPKTRKSRRTVPMPSFLHKLLVNLLAEDDNPEESALVFRVADEEPFQAERLYRYADHYWHKASLTEWLRLHA
jgi:hypothetical protein